MTDEVAELVLRDNYDQATVLGTARAQSRSLLPVHRRMISEMERAGQLDRELEAMPTDEDLAARAAAATGLTSPEFAVLLAYTKIILEREINESPLPDEAWTQEVLVDYFPTPLRDRYVGSDAGPSAAAGDRDDVGGERGRQPGRDLVRVPGRGGDRGELGRRDPGVRRGPGGVRVAGTLAVGGGAGQPAVDDGPDDGVPGGPPVGGPGGALARDEPALTAGRECRDRPIEAGNVEAAAGAGGTGTRTRAGDVAGARAGAGGAVGHAGRGGRGDPGDVQLRAAGRGRGGAARRGTT